MKPNQLKGVKFHLANALRKAAEAQQLLKEIEQGENKS